MGRKASVEQHSTVAARAAAYAVVAHQGQVRKGTQFPYVVHPIGVAHILRQYYPDDEALEAAGYLHDVLEDTDTPESFLRERFGDDVTDLVVGVTNNGNWRLADHLDNPRVLRLKAADTIDNILDTIRGLEKGHDVWSRFGAGRRKVKTWRKHSDLISQHLLVPDLPLREYIATRLDEVVTKAESL